MRLFCYIFLFLPHLAAWVPTSPSAGGLGGKAPGHITVLNLLRGLELASSTFFSLGLGDGHAGAVVVEGLGLVAVVELEPLVRDWNRSLVQGRELPK